MYPCYVFRSEIPAVPADTSATAPRDLQSSESIRWGKVWGLESSPNYSRLNWVHSSPAPAVKYKSLCFRSRWVTVLGAAGCWLSSTKLAEHLLSQGCKQLWATLAPWRGWGTAAGVTCRSVGPGGMLQAVICPWSCSAAVCSSDPSREAVMGCHL